MPFPQAPAGAWWILGGWRRSGWLWCCGRSCWWCSRRMTKRICPAGSGRGRRGAWRTWLAWGSLSSQSRLACLASVGPTLQVLLHTCIQSCVWDAEISGNLPNRPLGSFINDFLDLFDELHCPGLPGGVLPLHHLQRIVRCVELCSQALNRPDLHFEGAGNGPVAITLIGREHELYSGASQISLVEHYVTFRNDRSLLSLSGFVHKWPTSRWFAIKKKITGFH